MTHPRHHYYRIAAAVIVLAVCTAAIADPAPWFQWRSRVSGARVCAQNMPVQGWAKETGPYRDSRCEKKSPAK
jgi:hypothetical protein